MLVVQGGCSCLFGFLQQLQRDLHFKRYLALPVLCYSVDLFIREPSSANLSIFLCLRVNLGTRWQWRRKIVEFRGAEAREHAALPCFSALLLNIERIHPTILCYCLGCTQIHFHQTQTNY